MRTRNHSNHEGLVVTALIALIALIAVCGQGIAHAGVTTYVSNQASGSVLAAGSQIYDSANLANGVNPTGWLTFKVFGPGDSTCVGPPLFTTSTAVNGNGYYESSRFTTNAAGTYRWTVVYGGDAGNNPAGPTLCSDPTGQVVVGKRLPVISASRNWAPPWATDTATLSSGSGPTGPTGTLTFRLYRPNDPTCAHLPIFTSTRSVFGNGSYTSARYTPLVVGTYQWVVDYSGDANNMARSTFCADANNSFTVTVVPVIVTALPTWVARGGTVTASWSGITTPTSGDWVGLYPAGSAAGGPVAAWMYTNGASSGSTTLKFPWAATAGSYEVRLTAGTGQRLATSRTITLYW